MPLAILRFLVAVCAALCFLALVGVASLVTLAGRGYVVRNAGGSNVGLLYRDVVAFRIKGYGPDIDSDAMSLPLNAIVFFAIPPFAWCTRFRTRRPTDRVDARLLTASSLAVYAIALALLLLNGGWAVTCFLPVAVIVWLAVGITAAARRYQTPAQRRQAYRVTHGLCVNCGYDLRGTPSRCPECGMDAVPCGTRAP